MKKIDERPKLLNKNSTGIIVVWLCGQIYTVPDDPLVVTLPKRVLQ
jgi:hypothetical protein